MNSLLQLGKRMTVHDFKARLANRGWTLRALAREKGYHPSLLSHVLRCDYGSPRAERDLAEAAGMSVERFLRERRRWKRAA